MIDPLELGFYALATAFYVFTIWAKVQWLLL